MSRSRRLRRLLLILLGTSSCLALAATASAQIGSPAADASSVQTSRLSLAGIPQNNETLGNPRAPVRLLYFDDPQCPYCLEWHLRVLPALVERYVRAGKLQIQWRGFAVVGPDSTLGLRFVAAARLQDHLWDVLDDLFANQGEENSGWLSPSLLEEVGASIPRFDVSSAMASAGSPTISGELAADERLASREGIDRVPTALISLRGHRLKRLEGSELTPTAYERSINRLLHKRR